MDLRGKRGAWINQYAQPNAAVLASRAPQADYLIIKYGLAQYELVAAQKGWPWLAELMAEDGAGDQLAYTRPEKYGTRLGQQAIQPGCVGAVINLEEADGGWHNDNGTGTFKLIQAYRAVAGSKPLWASIDTRGNRPNSPYQKVLAVECVGVMPMVYPKAFGQSEFQAYQSAISALFKQAWSGKPVIPTLQTYDNVGFTSVKNQIAEAVTRNLDGISAYTMGHATQDEWGAFIVTPAAFPLIPGTTPVSAVQLLQARIGYLEAMNQLANKGTPDELLSFATFWKNANK